MATTFEMKQGQTGAVLSATLSDADGAVDLSTFAWVKMTVQAPPAAAVIDAVACTIDPDQTTNPGVITFAFTGSYAELQPATYSLEFTGQDGAGKIHVFPVSATTPYGTLVVLAPLG